jgi:hypothetical protein
LLVRGFFLLIQTLLLLIFEARLHFFQVFSLALTYANALLLATGCKTNPLASYLLLSLLSTPLFNRLSRKYASSIDRALQEDINLEFYSHKTCPQPDSSENDLPLPQGSRSERQKETALDRFFQSPAFEFLVSIGLLSLLITFREDLTPDLLHFVTCMVEEEGHFLWVMLLWLSFKCFLSLDPSQTSLLTP